MMRSLLLLIVLVTFSQCNIFKHGTTSDTSEPAPKRFNRSEAMKITVPDSVMVTGAQYLPIYGKRESGVNPDIQGLWVLESMDGFTFKEEAPGKLAALAASKKVTTKDTTYYNKRNGVNEIVNEVVLDGGSEKAKITPPQGTTYHIPERPTISFYGSNETFSGFSGCNRYSGRYEMPDSNALSLKSATASTRMVCLGDYDEDKFLETLHRVNKFKGTDDQLQLMEDDKVIMTFVRKKD